MSPLRPSASAALPPARPAHTVPPAELFKTVWVPPRVALLDRTEEGLAVRVRRRTTKAAPSLFDADDGLDERRVRRVWAGPFQERYAYADASRPMPPADVPMLWLMADELENFAALVCDAPPVARPRTRAVVLPLCYPDAHTCNLAEGAPARLRAHYRFTERREERTFDLRAHLNTLFAFDSFEEAHVSPDLANDLRELILLAESTEVRTLRGGLDAPTLATARAFERVGRTFERVRRR
ncbi:MAG: hypothetical protein WBA12_03155, partial [Catalinimonas sp.]